MYRKKFLRLFCLLILGASLFLVPAPVAQAGASVLRTDFNLPIDETMYVTCANNGIGEEIHVTGVINYHVQQITHPLKPYFYIQQIQMNYMGWSGVGLTSGMKYQISGNWHYQYLSPADTLVVNDSNSLKVVGPGKNNNYRYNYTVKITINDKGEWVVNRYSYSIECGHHAYP